MQRYLLVAGGGACGSMLRYLLGTLLTERFGAGFPAGTLVINLVACFLIGCCLEYLNHHLGLSPAWRLFIPIGFIGGFSTFSTFEWEIWASVSRGALWTGLLYIAASLFGGFLAVGAGVALARATS